jgi:hypothetical protein
MVSVRRWLECPQTCRLHALPCQRRVQSALAKWLRPIHRFAGQSTFRTRLLPIEAARSPESNHHWRCVAAPWPWRPDSRRQRTRKGRATMATPVCDDELSLCRNRMMSLSPWGPDNAAVTTRSARTTTGIGLDPMTRLGHRTTNRYWRWGCGAASGTMAAILWNFEAGSTRSLVSRKFGSGGSARGQAVVALPLSPTGLFPGCKSASPLGCGRTNRWDSGCGRHRPTRRRLQLCVQIPGFPRRIMLPGRLQLPGSPIRAPVAPDDGGPCIQQVTRAPASVSR